MSTAKCVEGTHGSRGYSGGQQKLHRVREQEEAFLKETKAETKGAVSFGFIFHIRMDIINNI